jgi:hypothetical protein
VPKLRAGTHLRQEFLMKTLPKEQQQMLRDC